MDCSERKTMADIVDIANYYAAIEAESSLAMVRRAAAAIPEGEPGECEDCGEESPRLVERLCARCRERINEAQRRNGRGGRIE
jgi:RNA polymerase-binding transcription factor DksA